MNIFEQINNRQTVKAYNDEKISDKDWGIIKKSITWSPSSFGYEPYRVLVINKGHELREKLLPIMWNQKTVVEADKLIFFISLKREVFTSKEWLFERGLRKAKEVSNLNDEEAKESSNKVTEILTGFQFSVQEANGDEWAMKQAYIAMGISLTTAALLNIGTTPIEGINKQKAIELFKEHNLIRDDENIAVAVAFGYPKSETAYAHFGSGKRVRDSEEKKFKEI